jgi:hypothetical protein
MDTKACNGAETESCRMGIEHAQECMHCGKKVRDDVIDHPFFGFSAGCSERDVEDEGA